MIMCELFTYICLYVQFILVVTAAFKMAEDKTIVMKEKSNLKDSIQYKDAYNHHDQSLEQRIMAKYFKAALSALNDNNANLSVRGSRVVRGNQHR